LCSIGTEHEKFGFKFDDKRRLNYDEIQQLLEGLADRFAWERVYENDKLIALKQVRTDCASWLPSKVKPALLGIGEIGRIDFETFWCAKTVQFVLVLLSQIILPGNVSDVDKWIIPQLVT
jgi:hypothetical protein